MCIMPENKFVSIFNPLVNSDVEFKNIDLGPYSDWRLVLNSHLKLPFKQG